MSRIAIILYILECFLHVQIAGYVYSIRRICEHSRCACVGEDVVSYIGKLEMCASPKLVHYILFVFYSIQYTSNMSVSLFLLHNLGFTVYIHT